MGLNYYREYNFAKSVNLRVPDAYDIKGFNPKKCQNWIPDSVLLKILDAYEKYNTVPLNIPTVSEPKIYTNPVKSGIRYYNSATGVTQTLVHIKDGVYKFNDSTSTLTRIGTDTFSDTNPIQWTIYDDTGSCYFVDGTGLYLYNGTSITQVNLSAISNPQPKNISTHFNRLLISGDADQPNKVYYSNAGSPETFSVDDNFDLDNELGGRITKHVFLNNASYFFMDNIMFMVTGNFINPPQPYIVQYVGSPSAQSVTVYKDKIFWYGDDGHIHLLWRLTDVNLTEIFIGKLPVHKSYRSSVATEIVNGKLWVSYTHTDLTYTFNDRVMICDFDDVTNPIWSGEHLGFRINTFIRYSARGDDNEVYFGDSYVSQIWKKSNKYYMGVGVKGVVNDSSATSSKFVIKVLSSYVSLFSLDTEDSLVGTAITFTSGDNNKTTRLIAFSSAATQIGSTEYYNITVTLKDSFFKTPADGDSIEIGQIHADYQTMNYSTGYPEKGKEADTLFINTRSAGKHNLIFSILKDGATSGTEYDFSLASDAAVWDEAVWDDGVWGEDTNIDRRISTIDVDDGRAKLFSLQFQIRGVSQSCVLRGFQYAYKRSDTLNIEGSI